ncbi:MAG: hypothetical protein HYU51_16855 [Candidatus Rokubacteria bacterium]|nr:hypothetical protein [Candidatus Rokubacteria bacterium]
MARKTRLSDEMTDRDGRVVKRVIVGGIAMDEVKGTSMRILRTFSCPPDTIGPPRAEAMSPPNGREPLAAHQPDDVARIIAELSQIAVHTRRLVRQKEILTELAEQASQIAVNTLPESHEQHEEMLEVLNRIHDRSGAEAYWPIIIIGGGLAVAIGIRLADWSRHWF